LACTLIVSSNAKSQAVTQSGLDTATIESVTGLKGVVNQKENTFKVSKPRNDVAVSIDQAPMAPFMGLTSWGDVHGGR
jgi:hypothetical protein